MALRLTLGKKGTRFCRRDDWLIVAPSRLRQPRRRNVLLSFALCLCTAVGVLCVAILLLRCIVFVGVHNPLKLVTNILLFIFLFFRHNVGSVLGCSATLCARAEKISVHHFLTVAEIFSIVFVVVAFFA